jgi:uncharacterized protein YndB with AHSA1/START domain
MIEQRSAVTVEAGPNAIRKSITVEASREHAFKVFTEGLDSWWPRSHHTGSSPLAESVIEPRQGGRWYGRSEDGTDENAGHVITWEPPDRVVLAWQLTGDWQFDPNFVTEVDVRFFSEGPQRTRVELEHRNLDRFGEKEAEIRETFLSEGGWTGLLGMFADAAEGRPVVGRT